LVHVRFIIQSMNPVLIFTGYVRWHYGKAFIAISVIWKNFLWFVGHFFSFALLLKTLFSPWKRMGEEYQHEGFHPSTFFQTLIVNTIMRIVGVFVRLIVILIGILFFAFVFIFGLLFIAFWIVAPIGIPVTVITGFFLLGI
jgi:hypothetical protein